jgi:SsrA-binding protein
MYKTITTNRDAFHHYSIIESLTAGIQLLGSEVKSIRNGKVSITEAYCFIQDGEIFIKGMHVAEYDKGGKSHTPLRDRKLLLKKKEILKLFENVSQKGLTIIPLKVFVSSTGLIKIDIGLCKGKKTYDKRESIKEKDIKRDTDRIIKNY